MGSVPAAGRAGRRCRVEEGVSLTKVLMARFWLNGAERGRGFGPWIAQEILSELEGGGKGRKGVWKEGEPSGRES